MKTVNMFEMEEEVYVKATITNIIVERGEIKYQLKDQVTGKNYGYLFTSDLLTPVKNTPPLIEGKTERRTDDGTEKRKEDIKTLVDRKKSQSQRFL